MYAGEERWKTKTVRQAKGQAFVIIPTQGEEGEKVRGSV